MGSWQLLYTQHLVPEAGTWWGQSRIPSNGLSFFPPPRIPAPHLCLPQGLSWHTLRNCCSSSGLRQAFLLFWSSGADRPLPGMKLDTLPGGLEAAHLGLCCLASSGCRCPVTVGWEAGQPMGCSQQKGGSSLTALPCTDHIPVRFVGLLHW